MAIDHNAVALVSQDITQGLGELNRAGLYRFISGGSNGYSAICGYSVGHIAKVGLGHRHRADRESRISGTGFQGQGRISVVNRHIDAWLSRFDSGGKPLQHDRHAGASTRKRCLDTVNRDLVDIARRRLGIKDNSVALNGAGASLH